MLPFLLSIQPVLAGPSLTGWSARATGLVGVAHWNGASSAMGGIRGAAGVHHQGAMDWRAAALGEVQWWGGVPYDLHLGEVAVAARRPLAPGASLAAVGSAGSRWAELTPSATLRLRPRGHTVQLRLGPSARITAQATPGASASVLLSSGLHPSLSLWSHIDVDAWSGSLPDRVLSGTLGTSWRPSPNLQINSSAGLLSVSGENQDWIAGLPPSGSHVLRGRLSAAHPLGERINMQLELSGDQGLGTLTYRHARLTAGLSVHRRWTQATEPEPELHRFELWAPKATTVSLTGSFTGWQPVAMERTDDGSWHLERTLPVGVHQYTYLVDGQPHPPPEAEQLQPDGFGGHNGILIIDGF